MLPRAKAAVPLADARSPLQLRRARHVVISGQHAWRYPSCWQSALIWRAVQRITTLSEREKGQ
jgi:hypothetical protein